MSEQHLFSDFSPPLSSRWEGYNSDSSKLTVATLNIEGKYNDNDNNNNDHIPLSSSPRGLPPPPQINCDHLYNNSLSLSISNSKSPIYNNNNCSSTQSKSTPIPLRANSLKQTITTDTISKIDNIEIQQPQLLLSPRNNKQGETDDGIAAMCKLSMDVDDINLDEYVNDSINDETDDEAKCKLIQYNQHINLIFGNPIIRSLYMNATLFLFCTLSFPLWFSDVSGVDNKTNKDVNNAYILAAFSMFIAFIASGLGLMCGICDIVRTKLPFEKTVRNVTVIMYIFGGFFHFVSACLYVQFYNNLGVLLNKDLTAFGGICFGQMFYISAYLIMLGIDFWKPVLNRMDYRIYVFFTLYAFCALILMFSYLICSDKSNGNSGFIGIGVLYFFGFIVSVMFLLTFIASNIITKEFVMKPKLDKMKPKSDLILSVLMFVLMLCTVGAYCATKRMRNTETVYYVGFGIFMLSNAILMSFDMRFSLYIAKFIEEKDE
eukprot:24659_1